MLAIASACVVVLAVKLWKLHRDPGDRALRAQCLMLGALAASVGIQPFVAALDRLIGVQKIGGFAGELAVTVAAGAGQVFLIRVREPGADARCRWSYRLLAATLVVLAVVFVLGAPDPYTARGETHGTAGHLGVFPLPYLYLYPHYGYLLVTLVTVVGLCLRYAAPARHPWLRVGLRTLAAGAVTGIVYVAVSLVALSLQEFRVDIDTWKTAITTPLYLATDTLVLLGCAIPSLARAIGTALRLLRDRRACRDLQPLWLALYHVEPGIALLSPADAGVELAMRLYRQVIEIRDGQLALRPYLDPRAPDLARALSESASLPDDEVAAISEAAGLAVAIAARHAGRAPEDASPPTQAPRGYADLDGEIAWLRRVSLALTSPIVARTMTALSTA